MTIPIVIPDRYATALFRHPEVRGAAEPRRATAYILRGSLSLAPQDDGFNH
jgi:hypothetical protein